MNGDYQTREQDQIEAVVESDVGVEDCEAVNSDCEKVIIASSESLSALLRYFQDWNGRDATLRFHTDLPTESDSISSLGEPDARRDEPAGPIC